jgi:hypothetical protein
LRFVRAPKRQKLAFVAVQRQHRQMQTRVKSAQWLVNVRSALVAAVIAISLAMSHRHAEARTERQFRYEPTKVWSTALRFVRVNENLAVIEKDADAGFILFELREEKKIFRGSVEILTVTESGRTSVRFVIQIADRPSYVEIAMMDRLERKLRDELGAPSPAPTTPLKPRVVVDKPGGGDDKDRKDGEVKDSAVEKNQ